MSCVANRRVLQSPGGSNSIDADIPMWALVATATPADLPPLVPLPHSPMGMDQPFALIVASVSIRSSAAILVSWMHTRSASVWLQYSSAAFQASPFTVSIANNPLPRCRLPSLLRDPSSGQIAYC